jgi:hypothetical protein
MRTTDANQAETDRSMSILSREMSGAPVTYIADAKAKNPNAWKLAREEAGLSAKKHFTEYWASSEGKAELKARAERLHLGALSRGHETSSGSGIGDHLWEKFLGAKLGHDVVKKMSPDQFLKAKAAELKARADGALSRGHETSKGSGIGDSFWEKLLGAKLGHDVVKKMSPAQFLDAKAAELKARADGALSRGHETRRGSGIGDHLWEKLVGAKLGHDVVKKMSPDQFLEAKAAEGLALWAGPQGDARKAKMRDLLRTEVHHRHFVHAHAHMALACSQTEYNP